VSSFSEDLVIAALAPSLIQKIHVLVLCVTSELIDLLKKQLIRVDQINWTGGKKVVRISY
jgi:hypothetical protein